MLKIMNKKSNFLFISVILASSLLFAIFIFKPWIYFKKTVSNGYNIQALSLSENQKLEDLNYLFEVICSSVPMINEYEEKYGFSFAKRKNEYVNLIKKTKSNYEYYSTMEAILEDVPSFHTDLVSPDSVSMLNCYNIENILSNDKNMAYNKYWSDYLNSEREKISDAKYWCFSYIDGKYIYDPRFSTADNNKKLAINKIDGYSPDEYVIMNQSAFNLYYDGKNDKPCRSYIVFNEQSGKEVSLICQDSSGNHFEKKLYIDFCFENSFIDTVMPIEDAAIIHKQLDNITYVKIDEFNVNYGNEIRKILSESMENVIIDLRDNFGGYPEFDSEYIYPELFSDDMIIEKKWFMVDSEENKKKIVDNVFTGLFLDLKPTDDCPYDTGDGKKYLYSVSTYNYQSNRNTNKNVILLVSHNTGSAADYFASFVKDNDLGIVIGNNTGGEGLMRSFVVDVLPNSHLPFIYMPGAAKNADGSDNSVVGTAPDEYVEMTEDNLYKRIEMSDKGENTSSLENMIIYDSVLKRAIDILKNP